MQTNQELPFLRWEEAVAFIRRYVTLTDENEPPRDSENRATNE